MARVSGQLSIKQICSWCNLSALDLAARPASIYAYTTPTESRPVTAIVSITVEANLFILLIIQFDN